MASAGVPLPPNPSNAAPARTSSLRVLLAGVAAALLLGFFVLLYTYPAAESFRSASLATTAAASKDRPVEIQASVQQNLFDGDEATLPVTVSILNRGAAALSDLVVCIEAPGFDLAARDNCVSQAKLEPLQRTTKQVPIKPLPHSGVYMLTAKVFWQQAAAEQAIVRVGPVKIDPTLGALRWNRFVRRLASVFKDLTLPVILVLVGAWLNRMQAEREDARRDAETDRETERLRIEKEREIERLKTEKGLENERLRIEREREENRLAVNKKREADRRVEERHLADRRQVQLLLLRKVVSLAEKHYLPIVSQTNNILVEAARIEHDEPLKSPDKLFFHVVKLLRLMEHLRTSESGVFLQKRTAERVVRSAWGIARSALYGVMGEARVGRAMGVVGVDWTFATFTDSQKEFVEFRELRKIFDEWMAGTGERAALFGKFSDYLGVLDVIQTVFLFEADRPLSEQWYEEPSTLRFKFPEPTTIPAHEMLPQSQQEQAAALKRDLEAFYNRKTDLQL